MFDIKKIEIRFNYNESQEYVRVYTNIIHMFVDILGESKPVSNTKDGFSVVIVTYDDNSISSLIYKIPFGFLLLEPFMEWFIKNFIQKKAINNFHHIVIKNNYIYLNGRKYNVDKHKYNFIKILTLIKSIDNPNVFYNDGNYHLIVNHHKIEKAYLQNIFSTKNNPVLILLFENLAPHIKDDFIISIVNTLILSIGNDDNLVKSFLESVDKLNDNIKIATYDRIKNSISTIRVRYHIP